MFIMTAWLRNSGSLRQIDLECAALPQLALHRDEASALLNDSVNDGEAESGAFAEFFRGEERLEDSLLCVGVHSHSGIADREHDILSWLYAMGDSDGVLAIDACICSADLQRAALRHCVASVDCKIHDEVLEFSPVHLHRPQLGIEISHELDGRTKDTAEHVRHVFYNLIHVEYRGFEQLLAAEGEQVTRERSAALYRLTDAPQVA